MNTPAKPGTAEAALEGVKALGHLMRDEEVAAETTAIVVQTPGEPLELEKGWTRDQVQLVKETIAKSAELTDDEFRLFIATCQRMKLDPLARQIHAVKRWDSGKGRKVLSIQIAIDGFRKIADDSGAYAGNDDPVYETNEISLHTDDFPSVVDKVPWKATVTVHKIVAGEPRPFTRSARWAEYYPGDGKEGFFWRKMPFVMLGKCAEALALRVAFPAELGGMYIPEEMDQAGEVVSGGTDQADDREVPGKAPANGWEAPVGLSREQRQEIAQKVEVPFGEQKGSYLEKLSTEHLDRLAKWCRARDAGFRARYSRFTWALDQLRTKTADELEEDRLEAEEKTEKRTQDTIDELRGGEVEPEGETPEEPAGGYV